MELKEGMYVRTNNGKIGKIIDINLGQEEKLYILDSSSVYFYYKEDISKSSYSLLGNDKEPCLIEAGDYVNGYKVDYISSYGVHIDTYLGNLSEFGFGENEDLIEIENIKSIVTKEQFESMSYKVGE